MKEIDMNIYTEWISGFMVGVEFHDEENITILDLGFFRVLFEKQ